MPAELDGADPDASARLYKGESTTMLNRWVDLAMRYRSHVTG